MKMLFESWTPRLKVVSIVLSSIAGFRARLVQPLFADILGEIPCYSGAVSWFEWEHRAKTFEAESVLDREEMPEAMTKQEGLPRRWKWC